MGELPFIPEAPKETSLRVSIALCTYNGALFLPQQLASITAQTTLPDELVACDDCSSDATVELLERFAETAPFPVRVFRNPQTLRPAQNFARAIGLCNGDIVVLTDQDDLWFEDRIAQTLAAFAADPALTFTFSDAPLVDGAGQDLGRTIYGSLPVSGADRRTIEVGTSLLPVLLRWGVLYGTTMAVRATLRERFLPLPAGWSHDEWIGLTLSAMGRSARLMRPATHYRQHSAQVVGTGNWTVGTHLGLARKQDASFYQEELERFRAGIAAATSQPALRDRLVPALEDKLRFIERRILIQRGGLSETGTFLKMVFTGQYRRFGSAWRSPMKDLLGLLGAYRKTGGAA